MATWTNRAVGRRQVWALLAGASLALLPHAASATFPDAERQALIDIYNASNGAAWTRRDNWRNAGDTDFNAPGTECTWYGITCAEGSVYKLELPDNNMDGVLPDVFGVFTHAHTVSLQGNRLSGAIAASFGPLEYLNHLDLSNNLLTGAIPDALGNAARLWHLYLHTNRLTGGIPASLGRLRALRVLALDHNELTGPIPSQLGQAKDLGVLTLQENQLSGAIPSELGQLTKLFNLDLERNQLTGTIPATLGDLQLLQSLNLRENHLSGPIPGELGQLAALQTLRASTNELSGAIPPQLGALSELDELGLDNNRLSGSIPPELGSPGKLRKLGLSANALTGRVPEALTALPQDVTVDIRWNALWADSLSVRDFLTAHQRGDDWESSQTVAPTDVGAVAAGETSLLVSWSPIAFTDGDGGYRVSYATTAGGPYTDGPRTASKRDANLVLTGMAPSMEYHLVVSTESDPSWLNRNVVRSERSAEVVAATSAEGYLTKERAALIDLYDATGGNSWAHRDEWRTADDTAFSPPGAECSWYGVVCDPSGTGRVWELHLDGNGLDGALPASLGELTELRQLHLCCNRLTGEVPYWLAALANLTWLDLGGNRLTGEVPAWLAALPALEDVGLGDNQLTGLIPPALGSAPRLRSLNLGANQLDGPIPAELGALQHLDALQLRRNRLTGGIPPALATLANLRHLDLTENLLTGPLPESLCALPHLEHLILGHNQFAGAIPPCLFTDLDLINLQLNGNRLEGDLPAAIGEAGTLVWLYLGANRLGGRLPAALGNLTGLVELALGANRFAGEIPAEMSVLTGLRPGGLDLNWNALTVSDPALRALLVEKHNGDWEDTQTVAPEDVTVAGVTGSSVTLAWNPIRYAADAGRYEALFGLSPAGPFTVGATTSDKTATGVVVSGLQPEATYYLAVRTVTEPSWVNPNTVTSEPSEPVAARTGAGAAPPTRRYAGVASITGTGGTAWRSEAALLSTIAYDQTVMVEIVPRGESAPSVTFSLPLASGALWTATDLYQALGAPGGAGLLRVTGHVLGWVRTFNLGDPGTYGQDVVEAGDALYGPGEAVLFPMRSPGDVKASFRSNLLVLNLEDQPATFTLAAGGKSRQLTVPAGTYSQVNNLGAYVGVAPGTAILSVSADGRWSGTVSTVDPYTGDPTTVRGLRSPPGGVQRYPGIAKTAGTGGTAWRSEAVLFNPGPEARQVTLELVPRDSATVRATKQLELGAGQVWESADLYAELGVASGAGLLRVSGDVMAWVRCFNQGESGTFGQDVVEVTETAVAAGQSVVVPIHAPAAIESEPRSNLLVVNLEESEIVLTLAAAGKTSTFTVPAGTYRQLNNVGQALKLPPGWAALAITAPGRWSGTVSTVDPHTGDPTTVRAIAAAEPG